MSRFAHSGSGRGAVRSPAEFKQMAISPGMVEEVYVTHIGDPEHFYVQLSKCSPNLDTLMDKLHQQYDESEETLEHPMLGSPCVAQFSEDNGWYRAIITGILKSGMFEVRFIDYGNSECVPADKVKDITPEFLNQPAMGLHCGLTGVSTTQGFWAPEHTVQFEDLALDQTFTATFRGFKTEEGILSVELVSDKGKNINKDFGTNTNTTCVEDATVGTQRHVQMGQGDADMQISLSLKCDEGQGASGQVYSNGDQGSVPSVDLSPGQNEVLVVYAFTPGEFWCQLVKFSDRLSILSTHMNQEYSRLKPGELSISSPRPGLLCAAKFCEDMQWYRGQIKNVGKDKIEVYFIDYGNTEKIDPDLVKDLKPGLKSEPAQAIKCMLSNLRNSSWSDAAAEAFENMTLDKQLLAISDGRLVDGKVPVKLKDTVEGYDIAEKLAEANHGTIAKSTIPRVPAHLAKQPSFTKVDVPVPSQTDVFLSWVENPGLFWVQLSNNQTQLDNLVEKVQEIYMSQATPVRSILPGMAVVAQYSEDGAWYRAIVQKMRGKKVDVLFVDFGNCDTVSADTLKEVSSPIAGIPMQAIQCSLTGIRPPPTQSEWTEDAKSVLEDITKDGAVCKFQALQNGFYAVKLSVGGTDVAEELVAAGVAKITQRSPGSRSSPESKSSSPAVAMRYSNSEPLSVGLREKAFVTHVDSLDSFWCQLAEKLPQLDRLMEQLEGFYSQGNGIQLPSPQPGIACVAKFSVDLAWYRAVVKSSDSNGISVHFVDYGNSEVVAPASVCSMGSQFLALPKQAIHCKLALQPAATDEMIDKFHELVAENEVFLKVLAVEDKVIVVDLLESDQSLTSKMKELFPALQSSSPQSKPSGRASAASRLDYQAPNRPNGKKETVFVSFTESPQMFSVHFAHIDSELDAIKEKLTAAYGSGSQPPLASPRPGQPCCALYAEDGAWYRGRIVETHGAQITVRFVDYGNADVVTAENIKPLSADLLSPGPLALECSLENVSPIGGTWTDDAIAFFETLTAEKEITCEFRQGRDVILSVDGVDVAQKMQEKGFLKTRPSAAVADSELSLIYNPPAVPSQPNKAFVTHVEDNGIFYIQLASAGALVEELSERLQELYNNPDTTSPLSVIQKGSPCCAKFTEDEAWYRAIIKDIQGRSVSVQFVDFGNTDLVSMSNVKSLEVDFFPIPPLAFQCNLQGLSSWKGDQKKRFSDLTFDKEITVKFLSRTAPYTVELTLGSQNLMKQLLPDLTSPPKSSFASKTSPPRRNESPLQKKTSPESSGPMWHEQSANRSFGSPPSPFGSSPARKEGNHFGSGSPRQEKQRSFGSAPTKKEGSPFGSAQTRPEPQGQRKPFGFAPPSKPSAPPPTLEKIPAEEQVYAGQSLPDGGMRSCISHVEKNDIYLQQTKDINNILAYSNKIKKLPTNEVTPVVGLACGALFTDDGTWYRAKVTNVAGDKVSVMFVDFGNSDIVAPSKLKQLSRELLGVPPFAYPCRLDGVGSLTPELTTVLAEIAADKEVNVKFVSQEIPYTAQMTTQDGKDLSQILCPTKFANQTAPSQVLPGVVSNIATDGTFYVQLLKDQENIKKMEEELKVIYANGTIDNPKSFENGKPCCARFPDDHSWQRGIVKSVEESVIVVTFVDLGVSETLNSAYVQILPRKFMFMAPFAYESILKDFTSWTEEQREKFISMTDGKTMNIQFVSSQAPPFKVEMTRSVGLELLGDKPEVKRVSVSSGSSRAESVEKAVPVAYPEQKLVGGDTGYVSFVDSDGTFYLQLSSEEVKLCEITEALQSEYSESGGERVFGLKVGMNCCAKFTQDDAWYRAVVSSIENDQITVRFVDYGNTDVITIERVAVLTSSNMSVHPLAYQCSLEGVKTWTESLVESFNEETREKTLTVIPKTEVHPFVVELKIEDDRSLKDILADEIAEANESGEGGFKWSALTVGKKINVYVSHVDSDLNFWVQAVAEESELAKMATAISEGYGTGETQESPEWMKDRAAVVAKYAEDEQWYRGILISVGEETCKVQFVDYGNADDVAKTDIYQIKSDHLKLTAQAMSCRLDKLIVVEGKEDAAMDALFDITNEKAVSLEVVKKVREEKVRYSVTLSSGGMDVRDKLVADGFCRLVQASEGEADGGVVEQSSVDGQPADTDNDALGLEQSSKGMILTELDEMVSAPNPFPVIELQEGQRISVHLLHTETPNEFYVQPESSKHGLDELMEGMFEFYNDLAEGDMVIEKPEVGQACASVYGEDGSWYRARVRSVKDGNCRVFNVDYGNTDLVACSAIRQLPEQFLKLPAQSVLCSLAGVRSKDDTWSQEAIDLFGELTSEKMLIMDILTVGSDGRCTVHLLHMGLAINKVLLEKNLGVDAATPVPISHKVKRIFSDTSDTATPQKLTFDASDRLGEEEEDKAQPDEAIGCISSTLNLGEQYKVYTSHVMNPGCFYCQLASSISELQRLMEQLQSTYKESSNSLDQSQLTVGHYAIARFTEDGQFFRAKILSVEESAVDVQLIDYGRKEKISWLDLLDLRSEFAQLPIKSFQCRLSEVGYEGEDWTEECCARFKKLLEEKELTAKIVSSLDSKCVEVELFSGDDSIGQILIDEELAVIKEEDVEEIKKRIESLIDPFPADEAADMTEKKVTTTKHEDGFEYLALVNEKDYNIEVGQDSILDQFILNLTSVTKQVEEMMKDISNYIDKDAPDDDGEWQPTVGKPCLVIKESETQWFRGKLVEVQEDSFKVYLVDYREMMRCQRDCIREMPARFLEVPVNGFKCQLADVAPVDGTWSQEAVTHFHDFASDSYLEAFLVSQSEEGIHSVRLHDIEDLGGATINRQLVDVGCAMPLPGSLVEMELQMEHASKDTSVLEEMERSFHDVSYQRDNSLGEDSDLAEDESGEMCQTFNTTGHSMLDQTADTTHGPDATLELVGETSTLDAERDMETPRPESAGDGAQEICHDIVDGLVSQTNDVSEAKGQEICKNIVDELVTKSGTGNIGDRDTGTGEKIGADEENEDEENVSDQDEAESDQQKQLEENEEFAECVGELAGEKTESDSATELGKEEHTEETVSTMKAGVLPPEDAMHEEGTESDTQETPGTEDSPECEKDEFYETDDGAATESCHGDAKVKGEGKDGETSPEDETCEKQDGAGVQVEADAKGKEEESVTVKTNTDQEEEIEDSAQGEEIEDSAQGDEIEDGAQVEADLSIREEGRSQSVGKKDSDKLKDDEKASNECDVMTPPESQQDTEQASHLAEEDH